MIDIATETLRTMSQGAALFPARPCVTTMWRWRNKGVNGRKLESITIGGKVYTSVEAIQRFCEQHGGESAEPTSRTPSAREKAIAKAERELADAGI